MPVIKAVPHWAVHKSIATSASNSSFLEVSSSTLFSNLELPRIKATWLLVIPVTWSYSELMRTLLFISSSNSSTLAAPIELSWSRVCHDFLSFIKGVYYNPVNNVNEFYIIFFLQLSYYICYFISNYCHDSADEINDLFLISSFSIKNLKLLILF